MTRFAAWALGSMVCGLVAGCGGRGSEGDSDGGSWVRDPGTADGGFVTSPTYHYRLARSADSVLAPSPDPTSFTFDGHDYWFLYGKETKLGARVVELDPATSTVARDWTVPPLLVDSPNAVFGGIAWDGDAIWIGSSGTGASVFRIAMGGTAEKGWQVHNDSGPVELSFDGKWLWMSGGTGNVNAIELGDGRLRVSFVVAEHSAREAGIALRTNEVWVSALFGGVDVYNPVTGALLNPVISKDGVAESNFRLGPIAFVGHRLGSLQGSRVVLYDIEAQM